MSHRPPISDRATPFYEGMGPIVAVLRDPAARAELLDELTARPDGVRFLHGFLDLLLNFHQQLSDRCEMSDDAPTPSDPIGRFAAAVAELAFLIGGPDTEQPIRTAMTRTPKGAHNLLVFARLFQTFVESLQPAGAAHPEPLDDTAMAADPVERFKAALDEIHHLLVADGTELRIRNAMTSHPDDVACLEAFLRMFGCFLSLVRVSGGRGGTLS